MKKINKAFTLVELIVVITILAILATIGFVSFSGYLAGTRDTNRVAQLKSMSDALELYRTKKDLPIPDDKIDIKASGSVIAYQGYIGKNVLETIEYTESGLDPKDKNYFSYYLTKNKKYFQLLAFLEEENEDVVAMNAGHPQGEPLQNNVMGTLNATDYSERYPKTTGKKLGILTGTGTDLNKPVQEILTGSLDIATTTDEYVAHFSDSSKLSGTGAKLVVLEGLTKIGGNLTKAKGKSCKDILDKYGRLPDGIYKINPTGSDEFKVYCDMTTDGGGWTKVAYSSDLEYKRQFSGGDGWKWLSNNFTLELTDEQINSIRKVSTEAKQKYVGLCNGVIHYYYNSGNNYSNAFGFRFHTGLEQNGGLQNYGNGINVIQDGCKTNGGEGGNLDKATIFEIHNIALPIINIKSQDNGDGGEYFGSPLKNNPAWFR